VAIPSERTPVTVEGGYFRTEASPDRGLSHNALHRSLAALSRPGEVRNGAAGHVILSSNPDLLVAAVRELIERIER